MTKAWWHLESVVLDWEEPALDFLDPWLDIFQNGAKRV